MVAAAICWSTAGTLQRELTVDTASQIAGRSGVAAVVLTVLVAVQSGGRPIAAFRSVGKLGIVLAVCMAGASACFIVALNRATVASVLFMQALSPFIAIVLAWVFLHEGATRRTWLATGGAIVGVIIMVGSPAGGSALGTVASFVMAVLFAVTIVVARHRRDISMTPAVTLSQVLLFVCAAPFASFDDLSGRDVAVLLALGIFQTGLGQAFFVIGARLISASEVAMITLLEVILGPIWVWLFQGETTSAATLFGGALVLAAVVVQATDPSTPADVLADPPKSVALG
jgi:drug/metabolite transporter (DMT)-like permease